MAAAWTPERGWHEVDEPTRKEMQREIVANIAALVVLHPYRVRFPSDAGFCDTCGVGRGHNRSV